MHRLALVGRKGGVGKTAVSVTVAADLASRFGWNVLLIDMDPQANSTSWLGVDAPKLTMNDVLYNASTAGALDAAITETDWQRVWLAPAEEELASRESDSVPAGELRLRRVLRTAQLDWCDAVVMDSPPSLSPLLLNVLNATTDALVVADAERGGLDGVARLLDTAAVIQEDSHPSLRISGLVMNQYNAATAEHPARWQEMGERYGSYPRWRLPNRVAVATAYGASVAPQQVRTASPFVSAVRDVVDAVVQNGASQ